MRAPPVGTQTTTARSVPTLDREPPAGEARGPYDPDGPPEREAGNRLVEQAWKLIEAGDYAGAQARAQEALRSDPRDASALEVLALALLKAGNYPEAIAAATRAIRINPRGANAWAFRAYARDAMGDRARALADIEEAARLEPGYGETLRMATAGGWIFGELALDSSLRRRIGRFASGRVVPFLALVLCLLLTRSAGRCQRDGVDARLRSTGMP